MRNTNRAKVISPSATFLHTFRERVPESSLILNLTDAFAVPFPKYLTDRFAEKPEGFVSDVPPWLTEYSSRVVSWEKSGCSVQISNTTITRREMNRNTIRCILSFPPFLPLPPQQHIRIFSVFPKRIGGVFDA